MCEALAIRVAGLVASAYAAKAEPSMPAEVRDALAGWLAVGGRLARAANRDEISHEAVNADLDRYEGWTHRRGPRLVYLDEFDGTVAMV